MERERGRGLADHEETISILGAVGNHQRVSPKTPERSWEEGQGLAGKVDVSHQDEARMGWGWGVRRLCFGLTETSDGK